MIELADVRCPSACTCQSVDAGLVPWCGDLLGSSRSVPGELSAIRNLSSDDEAKSSAHRKLTHHEENGCLVCGGPGHAVYAWSQIDRGLELPGAEVEHGNFSGGHAGDVGDGGVRADEDFAR